MKDHQLGLLDSEQLVDSLAVSGMGRDDAMAKAAWDDRQDEEEDGGDTLGV